MSKVLTDPANYTAIATAIRNKGVNGTFKPREMATAINSIPTGITPTGKLNITNTSVQDVTNYAQAQVVDANLKAENIAKGVTILGIPGAHEGGGGSGATMIECSSQTQYKLTFPNSSTYTYYAIICVSNTGYAAGTPQAGFYTYYHPVAREFRALYHFQNKTNFTKNSSEDEIKRSGNDFNINSSYQSYGMQFFTNTSQTKYIGFFWN